MEIDDTKCPNCAGLLKMDMCKRIKICTFCDSEFGMDRHNTEKFNNSASQNENPGSGTFQIKLLKVSNKVVAIRVYREISRTQLREAKAVIDQLPVVLFKGLDRKKAEKYTAMFKQADPLCEIIMEEE